MTELATAHRQPFTPLPAGIDLARAPQRSKSALETHLEQTDPVYFIEPYKRSVFRVVADNAQLKVHIIDRLFMSTLNGPAPEIPSICSSVQRVLPGQYIYASPHISHRRHLLKPCHEMNEAFEYLLALCAKQHNMVVYAASMMSTHYDLVMFDQDGCHPDFFMNFHRMLAEFVHAKYDIDGNVFAAKPSRVVCLAPEAVADKIAQTLANPVSGVGVRNEREWPGFRTRVDEMGRRVLMARRPKHYFGNRKTLPEKVVLQLGFPPVLEERFESRQAACAAIKSALEMHKRNARAAINAKGLSYLGKTGAQKVDHLAQATCWSIFGRISRRLATLGLSSEDANKAWEELKKWTDRYHTTRRLFLEGVRNILWPYGTWSMVRHLGMDSEAPPTR